MKFKAEDRVGKALELAVRFGGIDGDHHKAWVIDQMVRALTGCPMVKAQLMNRRDEDGNRLPPIDYQEQGESEEYTKLVKDACDGEDGPNTYDWDVGIPP